MRVASYRFHEAGKWSRWASVLLLVVSGMPLADGQQRHEDLRVVMQLTTQPDGARADVTVRIYNVSNRTVNILVPKWIDCDETQSLSDTKLGSVSLQWKYKGNTMNSARAVQGIQSSCIGDPAGLSEFAPPSKEYRAAHIWMHFAPGRYAEVHGRLTTDDMLGGKYEVRAVYRSPAFTREQQQDIRDGGLEMPKGEYKSAVLSFNAPD